MAVRNLKYSIPTLITSMFLASLMLAGCDLGQGLIDNSNALTSPEPVLLDQPGRQLAEGSYRDLVIDGSVDKGGYVLAIEETRESEPQLLILPYREDKGCNVKNTTSFARVASRVDIELPGLVAVQESVDQNGKGPIRFVGFDCEDKIPAVSSAALPTLLFPIEAPEGVLLLESNQILSLIDPRRLERVEIARNVTSASVARQRLYTIENGRLVIRDATRTVIAELGKNVEEFTTQAAQTLGIAYRDEEGLFVWQDDQTTLITPNGCGLSANSNQLITSYLDCEKKQPLLLIGGELLSDAAQYLVLTGPPNSGHFELWLPLGNKGSTQQDLSLAIMLESSGSSIEPTSALRPLDVEFFSFAKNTRKKQGYYYQNLDSVEGDLLQLRRDEKGMPKNFEVLAERVAQLPGNSPFSPAGVLINFDPDKSTGQLVRLQQKKDDPFFIVQTPMAIGVPLQLHQFDLENSRQAFVSDINKGVGQLVISQEEEMQRVAQSVLPDTLQLMTEPAAVVYLGRSKSDSKLALRAWLINDELELVISPNVEEYRIIPWPSPGLLYSVPTGADAGIWLSKAR